MLMRKHGEIPTYHLFLKLQMAACRVNQKEQRQEECVSCCREEIYRGEGRDRCVCVCWGGVVFVLSVGEGVEQDSVNDV